MPVTSPASRSHVTVPCPAALCSGTWMITCVLYSMNTTGSPAIRLGSLHTLYPLFPDFRNLPILCRRFKRLSQQEADCIIPLYHSTVSFHCIISQNAGTVQSRLLFLLSLLILLVFLLFCPLCVFCRRWGGSFSLPLLFRP